MKKQLLFSSLILLFIGIIVILIAYPNPLLFFQTMERFIWLPIDPKGVASVSATLPDDPRLIEGWVNTNIVYASDSYETWGVFAYIATPSETLLRRRGPCRARAILFASILEAKGIPYRLYANALHAWVDYESRNSTSELEQPQHAFLRWEKGRWHFNGFGWLTVAPEQLALFIEDTWVTFPPLERIILVFIVSVGGGCFCYLFWRKRRHRNVDNSSY